MHILVSNDDGINSKGLMALAEALGALGKVTIIAPDRERSACSHALTLERPLRIKRISENFYSVDGTPSDCINLGLNGFLKERPDMVAAGINLGPNMGDDVIYSGTVAAAMEGVLLEVPAFAISIDARRDFVMDLASATAIRVARFIIEKGLPPNVLLNVNVPDIPADKAHGIRWTRQGKTFYGDPIVERTDPRHGAYYWIGGNAHCLEKCEGSDVEAVGQGFVSVTPLLTDQTDTEFLKTLAGQEI